MKNIIFTIADEGLKGQEIGKKLAKELNIAFYEDEIIELASKKSGISKDIFHAMENSKVSYFCPVFSDFSLSVSFVSTPEFMPIPDKIFIEKTKAVRSLCGDISCVIFCKCANYMLRENNNCINILIYSSDEDIFLYTKSTEKLNDKKTNKKIKQKNKILSRYYNYFTGDRWDNKKSYDILINSSTLAVNTCVKILKSIYNENKI